MKNKGNNQKVKNSLSEELDLIIKNRKKFSRKEIKQAFSEENTKQMIDLIKKVIKDKQMREQNIAFIRAANGKKIRNTSGV